MALNEMIFKRKSMEQITDRPDAKLEPARLAPSAVNSQPWFFAHEGDTIHVWCSKKGRRLDADVENEKIKFLVDMSYELTK